MAPAFVQANGIETNSSSATLVSQFNQGGATNPVLGNLVIVAFSWANTSTVGLAISDNSGDGVSWNLPAAARVQQGAQNYLQGIAYKVIGAGWTTATQVTFTPGGAPASFLWLGLHEYSGADTLDQAKTGNGTTGTAMTSAAFTTTQANEIIFQWGTSNAGGTSMTTPFTSRQTVNTVQMGDEIVSSIQTGITGVMTAAVTGPWALSVATFYSSGGGGAPSYTGFIPPRMPIGV